ncbi:MAG: hypothetical protein ACOYMA_00640 [Bacteroidia bacterium]
MNQRYNLFKLVDAFYKIAKATANSPSKQTKQTKQQTWFNQPQNQQTVAPNDAKQPQPRKQQTVAPNDAEQPQPKWQQLSKNPLEVNLEMPAVPNNSLMSSIIEFLPIIVEHVTAAILTIDQHINVLIGVAANLKLLDITAKVRSEYYGLRTTINQCLTPTNFNDNKINSLKGNISSFLKTIDDIYSQISEKDTPGKIIYDSLGALTGYGLATSSYDTIKTYFAQMLSSLDPQNRAKIIQQEKERAGANDERMNARQSDGTM